MAPALRRPRFEGETTVLKTILAALMLIAGLAVTPVVSDPPQCDQNCAL